jgi:lysophospholipase L1-like esterase
VYGISSGLHPLSSGLSGGKMFSVDALGFWKYAAHPDHPAGGWLLLGDSVTMGIGVEPDSTFAGRLAAFFPGWLALNPSWIGYSSADYLNVVRTLLAQPRVAASSVAPIRRVTIFWTLNDIYSHCDVGLPPGQAVREYGSSILNWLRQHYRTYAWLKRMFFDRPKAYFDFDAQFYRPDDPRFVAASQDLSDIKTLCGNAGVQLDIVLLPYEYQLRRADSASYYPQVVLRDRLDSLHIRWYDFASTFRGLPGNRDSLYLFGDGIHFSEHGHREIARFVQDTVCIPPR